MKKELADLIATARRELRMASGLPLTAEEREQERILKEVQALEEFMFSRIGIRCLMPLSAKVVLCDGKANLEFTADQENKFHLRPNGKEFELFSAKSGAAVPLLKLKTDDPQFVNRVLVAIGDNLTAVELK